MVNVFYFFSLWLVHFPENTTFFERYGRNYIFYLFSGISDGVMLAQLWLSDIRI